MSWENDPVQTLVLGVKHRRISIKHDQCLRFFPSLTHLGLNGNHNVGEIRSLVSFCYLLSTKYVNAT